MMIQAFYTGVSGLKTYQEALDVVSDNAANTSTIGFRGYSAEFTSLFEKQLNTTHSASSVDSSVGVGTRVNAISMDNKIGSYMLTERSTDLAIMGSGWFGIQGDGVPLYTRDGSFVFNSDRDLVTNDGHYVLGTMGKNIVDGKLTEQLAEVPLGEVAAQEKLRFPENLTFPTQPTTEVKFYGNLSTEDETMVMSAKAIDPENNKNNIRLEFKKVDPQVLPGSQWNVVATAQSLDVKSVFDPLTGETYLEPAEIYDTQIGVVEFDDGGALIANTLGIIDNNGSAVKIDLSTGFNGVTAIKNPFIASSSSDGIEAGELAGYDINRNGEVVAAFTNGMQSSVGTIAIYHFTNERGLERVNGSRFAQSSNSGEPLFFKDDQGRNRSDTYISNYKLESSNVRMEVALTEMIIIQKAHSANSKCVTTADEMLQKALSMHR